MADLFRRTVVSSISILILICLILFAFNPIFQFVVAAAVAGLAGIAIWEYEQFVKAKGGRMILPGLILLTVAQVFAFFLSAKSADFISTPLIFFFIAFLILFALHFGEKEGAIVDLAVSSFGLLYIAIPMGMLLGILYSNVGDGRWWVTYLLVVTKITDMGAYFAGSLWGRRKLAPSISPKRRLKGLFLA